METSEPRVLICYGCHEECMPQAFDGGYYGSSCCDGIIVDQDGHEWTQSELAEEAHSENAAREEPHA